MNNRLLITADTLPAFYTVVGEKSIRKKIPKQMLGNLYCVSLDIPTRWMHRYFLNLLVTCFFTPRKSFPLESPCHARHEYPLSLAPNNDAEQ